ncbi:hypothetical protein [Succinivibrio sp.]|uniref:hypothetical protein n=2 Tax=Succinivibrio sp. TaxID=2053619 RepID=UPI0038709505
MTKKKLLELHLRICMVAMVIAIILGVFLAPLQLSKPNAVLKINHDREQIINAARTELMLSKTQKEMSYRVNVKPLGKIKNLKEDAMKQAYHEHVSRKRGINLLEDYPIKGTAGNKTLFEMKLKEKAKVKSKTKTLSESFMNGFGSSNEDETKKEE